MSWTMVCVITLHYHQIMNNTTLVLNKINETIKVYLKDVCHEPWFVLSHCTIVKLWTMALANMVSFNMNICHNWSLKGKLYVACDVQCRYSTPDSLSWPPKKNLPFVCFQPTLLNQAPQILPPSPQCLVHSTQDIVYYNK